MKNGPRSHGMWNLMAAAPLDPQWACHKRIYCFETSGLFGLGIPANAMYIPFWEGEGLWGISRSRRPRCESLQHQTVMDQAVRETMSAMTWEQIAWVFAFPFTGDAEPGRQPGNCRLHGPYTTVCSEQSHNLDDCDGFDPGCRPKHLSCKLL